MNDTIITLDVREDIRQGREPFGRIMQTVGRLRPAEKLRLLAPFEPVPLFRVMAHQGFTHEARPTRSGDWEVLFAREEAAGDQIEEPQSCGCSCAASSPRDVVEVDACGLQPPQPMVRILEVLAELPAGAEMRARTDWRPLHLYAHLKERGFTGESEEQEDGSFITHIRPS